MKKISNLSLYDIRKAARSAQNSLFAAEESQFETKLREITTNDPWGPSTKQLNELLTVSLQEQGLVVRTQIDIVFERVAKYSEPEKNIRDRRHRNGSISSSIYNAAVSYVNQGIEWRIVNKCLKVLEFLLINSPSSDQIGDAIGENQIYLERIIKKYQSQIDDFESQYRGDDIVPTAKLKEIEAFKVVKASAEEVLSLFRDKGSRQQAIKKSLKMATQLKYSGGNDVKPLKKDHDVPSYEKNYKTKTLDRHKIFHSNIKSQVRNEIQHVIPRGQHEIKTPVFFEQADSSGRFKANIDLLVDDIYDSQEEDLDYTYPDKTTNPRFHDNEKGDSTKDELKGSEEDDFGEFQTPIETTFGELSIKSETLAQNTPPRSNIADPLIDIGTVITSVSSPTADEKDVFASVFKSAKT